jgi:hypothetical protein
MRSLILIPFLFLWCACQESDTKQLIGRWHNENHWFEFHNDSLYSGGVGPIVNVENVPYDLDAKEGKLTFYTRNQNETYYLRYKFLGMDSLSLSNFMNSENQAVVYYRKK